MDNTDKIPVGGYRLTLNDGNVIPQLGQGMYLIPDGPVAYNAVKCALETGFRHIDTAHAYQNERSVGKAVKESGIPRDQIWITSKLWVNEYGPKETLPAIERMLKRLDTDYIDLVYLHQAVGDYVGAWQELIKAQQQGKVRSIGISDFDYNDPLFDNFINQVEKLPAMMQIECHPFAQRIHWEEKLKAKGIQLEAWFPLGGRDSKGAELADPTIDAIARAHGKSAAQVIIRWHLQKGHCVVPGSSNPEHIRENYDVFDFSLSDEEMKQIADLNKEQRYFTLDYDQSAKWFNEYKLWD